MLRRAAPRLLAALVCLALTGIAPGLAHPDRAEAAGLPTIDGLFSGTGPIPAGGSVDLQVTGRGGVPSSGVGAVALNVTVANPTVASFLTVHPTGSTRPNAANLVFTPGQVIPNLVVVPVGTNGRVTLFNFAGSTDVVVDVQGWFPTGAITGINPARLLDTRPGYTTIDGQQAGTGPLGAGATRHLPVTGRANIPADATAVAMNVTATNPTAPSFLTVHPTGTTRPNAANLNMTAGLTISNMVIAKIGANGQIDIDNFAGSTDVVVDALAWVPSTSSYTGITPARVLDTRPGYSTVDGQQAGTGALGADSTRHLPLVGRAGIPVDATAVVLNVTATNPTAASFVTVHPTGTSRPTAANLNMTPGQTIPNLVIAKLGTGGQIDLYQLTGSTDLVVDVQGWFTGTGTYTGLTPARLMDTRDDGIPTSPPPTGPAVLPNPGTWANVTSNLAGMASECGNLTMLSPVPGQDAIIAGVAQKGLWRSTDGGASWTRLGAGAGSAVITNRPSSIVYDPAHPSTFWESGIYNGGGVYRTDDGGATFTQLGNATHIDQVSVDLADPARRTLVAGGHESAQRVLRSADGGATWTNIGANLPAGTGFSSNPMVLGPTTYLVNANTSWGGGSPGIYRTTDAGATWAKVSTIGPAGTAVVTGGAIYWRAGDHLAKSADGGLSWTSVGAGLTIDPTVLTDGRLLSATSNRLVVSADGGVTWTPFGANLPYSPAGAVHLSSREAVFAWHWDCGSVVLSDAIMRLR
jgi:hypothetical protein